MRIEAVRIRDEAVLTVLEAVWESSVRATHTFLSGQEIEDLRPAVREGLLQVQNLLGMWEDDKLIAFAGVEDGVLEMLFVDAEQRGKGAGKKLLAYAVTVCGARQLDVNEQNPQAAGFYQRMGFQQTGRMEQDRQGRPYPLLQMELTTEALREMILTAYFGSWLEQDDSLLVYIFDSGVYYSESWGPEYLGLDQVQYWFREWNTRAKVELWEIRQFLHDGEQTVAEWQFRCSYNDGKQEHFNGVSLVRWTGGGQIVELKEFGSSLPRYNPYDNEPNRERR